MIMPRRPFTPIFIPLLWLLIVAGCSSAPDLRLQEVEAMMEQSPDSALVIIGGVDTGTLHSDADKALYNLLLTQVCYKNYRSLPPDSVIGFSVRYYTSADDSERLMLSLYYQAVVFRENGNINSAITPALHSEELARKLGSPLWIARTNELLSDIFYDNYSWEESMRHIDKAIAYYNKIGRSLNKYYSLLHKASLYADLGDMEQSLNLCDRVLLKKEEWNNDSVLMAHTIDALFYPLVATGQYDRAMDYISIRTKYPIPLSPRTYIMWSYVFQNAGELEHLKACVIAAEKASTNGKDKLIVWMRLREIRYNEGNLEESIAISDSIFRYYNVAVDSIVKQSALLIEGNYTKKKLDEKNLNILRLSYTVILVSILLIFAILGAFIWHKYQKKKRKLDVEEKINLIYRLNSELSALRTANSNLQSMADRLFDDHYHTINILCQELFEGDSTEKDKLRIFNRIEAEIVKLGNEGNISKMIDFVDQNKDGRLSRFFKEMTDLSDVERRVITFICVGLSSKAISLLMGMKYKTFHTVKRRLKEKIAESAISDSIKYWVVDVMTFRK